MAKRGRIKGSASAQAAASTALAGDRTAGAATSAGAAAPRRRRAMPSVQQIASRSFVGGDLDFSLGEWRPPSSGANSEIYGDLQMLRRRSHDLARNSPLAVKILETLVSSMVGARGIRPQAATSDIKLNEIIDAYYQRWAAGECDVAHDRNMATLQAQYVMAWLEGGTSFVRRRWRRVSDGLTVPLQLEILEGEYCALDVNGKGQSEGYRVTTGVEFDPIGRRVAYHLYKAHPDERLLGLMGGALQTVRVPARDVAMLTWAKRPGQVHGVPWLTPAMRTIYELERYERTEQVRKEQELRNAAFLIADDTDDELQDGATPEGAAQDPDGIHGGYVGPAAVNADGQVFDEIPMNAVVIARGTKDVKFAAPTQNPQYESYVRTQLRKIAAAVLTPSVRISSDWSEITYSSFRAGDLEYRRLIQRLAHQLLIPLVCQRIWDWFIEALSVVDERVPLQVPVTWYVPRFEELDPLKETTAQVLAVDSGFETLQSVIGESRGEDWRDVMRQRKTELDYMAELGLPDVSESQVRSRAAQARLDELLTRLGVDPKLLNTDAPDSK